MNRRTVRTKGFTIIELLTVIVVVGILAAITIVAFNGVRQDAGGAVLQADLRNAATQLEADWLTGGSYPANITDEVERSEGTNFEYSTDTANFCLTASSQNARTSYFYDSATQLLEEGSCPGHEGFVDTGNQLLFSVGNYHACAYNGTLYCWGSNYAGQIGDGTENDRLAPVPVDTSTGLAGKTITALSAGEDSTCVIADNTPYCWGEYGRLFYDPTTSGEDNVTSPLAIDTSGVLAGKELVAIAAGNWNYCVLDSEGAAYCWGGYGPLGNGLSTGSEVPVTVDRSGEMNNAPISKIDVGNGSICATANARAYCWGSNRTGDGTNTTRATPVAVDTSTGMGSRAVTDISASSYGNNCAVVAGEVYCWGYDCCGNQGNTAGPINQTFLSPRPMDMTGVLLEKTVARVSAGYVHSCAIADGEAFCFGAEPLGDGTATDSTAPVAVSTSGVLSGLTLQDIDAGEGFACATADLNLYCWGVGQGLGYGSYGTSLVPIAVPGFGG